MARRRLHRHRANVELFLINLFGRTEWMNDLRDLLKINSISHQTRPECNGDAQCARHLFCVIVKYNYLLENVIGSERDYCDRQTAAAAALIGNKRNEVSVGSFRIWVHSLALYVSASQHKIIRQWVQVQWLQSGRRVCFLWRERGNKRICLYFCCCFASNGRMFLCKRARPLCHWSIWIVHNKK